MHSRPSCFEVFTALAMSSLAGVGVLLLWNGAWSPRSPLFRPMLWCFGGATVILVLLLVMAFLERRRNK